MTGRLGQAVGWARQGLLTVGAVLGVACILLTLGAALFVSLVATVATHAVFFGSGRYSMVVFPLVTAFAFCRGRPAHGPKNADTSAPPPARGDDFDSPGAVARY